VPQNQATNNFATTLSTAALSGDTTLTLTSVTGLSFPCLLTLTTAGASGPPFAKIEIAQATGISSGTTVNVVRAKQGTTAQAWSIGDTVGNDLTAGDANGLVQAGWIPDLMRLVDTSASAIFLQTSVTGSGAAHSTPSALGQLLTTGATSASTCQAVIENWQPVVSGQFNAALGSGIAFFGQLYVPQLPATSGDSIIFGFGPQNGAQYGQIIGLEIAFGASLTTSLYVQGVTSASAVSIADNAWHRFFMWMDSTGTYIYIDGVLAGSTATTISFSGTYVIAEARVANGASSTTNVQLFFGMTSVAQSY